MKISIIGSGNIGSALVTGLLRDGSIAATDISLADISLDALVPFTEKGIRTMQNNNEAVKNANIVVVCVKPSLVCNAVREILPSLNDNTLLVSLAAGISIEQLIDVVGKRALFRVIPNTAMAVNQSMTCIAASDDAQKAQIDTVLELFSRVGKAILINESLMNVATIIASCGTAFALRYLRAAMTAGVEIGLRPDVAKVLIAQTMLGAAVLVTETGNHPETEIDKVTTPNGITIKGLNEMEHAGFSSAVMQGIVAAYEKIIRN